MYYGIKEDDFWDWTFAEVLREIDAEKERLKRKAQMDYTQADLLAYSLARLRNSEAKMPEIADAYPFIYNTKKDEQKKQEKHDELQIARFKNFAHNFNKRHQELSND